MAAALIVLLAVGALYFAFLWNRGPREPRQAIGGAGAPAYALEGAAPARAASSNAGIGDERRAPAPDNEQESATGDLPK